jgi:predicted nucleotidyltransferase
MTQTQCAASAGLTQPVISAYERGRRQPSLAMLDKIIAGTGQRLEVAVVPEKRRPAGRLRDLVRQNRAAILGLAKQRGLSHVRLFGSAARGDDGPDSDIDLLVRPRPGTGLVALIGFANDVGELLGVHVDVVPEGSLKPSFASQAMAEAVPL